VLKEDQYTVQRGHHDAEKKHKIKIANETKITANETKTTADQKNKPKNNHNNHTKKQRQDEKGPSTQLIR
jgi:hypothetical protein